MSSWSYYCKRCVSLDTGHQPEYHYHTAMLWMLIQKKMPLPSCFTVPDYFLPSKNRKYSLEEKPGLLEDHNSEPND